jgi:hypothetical protein
MFEAANISQIELKGWFQGGFENNILLKFVIRKMLKRFIHLLLILCPIVSYGQLGVNVKYLFGQSDLLEQNHLSQDGVQASLEYSFRLKEKRLEFHPGLGYRFTFFNEIDNDTNLDEENHGYFNSLDLDFNTSIYPFDFGGDCDCPTFSKEGNLIKKGFFLEVSPGLGYQTLHRDYYESDPGPADVPISSTNLAWKLSFGGGMDIGLTEEFTLTPLFSWTKISNEEWDGLTDYGETGVLDDQTYLGAGLRFTYKPDPKRRRRF